MVILETNLKCLIAFERGREEKNEAESEWAHTNSNVLMYVPHSRSICIWAVDKASLWLVAVNGTVDRGRKKIRILIILCSIVFVSSSINQDVDIIDLKEEDDDGAAAAAAAAETTSGHVSTLIFNLSI